MAFLHELLKLHQITKVQILLQLSLRNFICQQPSGAAQSMVLAVADGIQLLNVSQP